MARITLNPELRVPTKQPHYMFGRKASAEHRAKISEALRGYVKTIEHRANMSAAQKGKKRHPDIIEKIAAKLRGRRHSPELCAKRAAAIRGKKRSPEQRERIAAAQRGKKLNPEHIAKLIAINTGRVCLSETREKLRKANKGTVSWAKDKKFTLEHRAKISAAKKKPTGTRQDDLFPYPRNSTVEVVAWRKSVFERDHFTCQHCEHSGVTLNAHHIKPWAKFKELRFEIDNGITLCVSCHRAEHKRMRKAANQ